LNREISLQEMTTAEPAPEGPPRPPFVFSIGVTGHRIDALGADLLDQLREQLGEILALIERTAFALLARERDCFAGDPPRLCLVSPLADGADQIASEAAVDLGWEIHAVLPFARAYYRSTLSNEPSRESFDALLQRANRILELPGEKGDEPEGYAMAGRATIAHCDVLIAIWDGLKPRGRGGTGEVVELAIASGTPVVHIAPELDRPAKLLWAAFDPVVDTMGIDPMAERPFDAEHVEQMLTALLLPPPGKQEHHFLQRFLRERLPRFRPRIEYLLLLTLAGVRKIRASDLTEKAGEQMIREEWADYRAKCVTPHGIDAPLDALEHAYGWVDRLATNLAQTYRSGHIFSFVMGGLAVCMGLSAFMMPHLKFQEAAFEMLITVAIILNAYIGGRNEWHRRWLDYRQLAERLRPMRSLKLLGIAAPDPPGTETNPVPQRWIDWYAMGVWRAMGCPSGTIDRETAGLLAEAIGDHEVGPQVSYHVRNSARIELLDKRLEKFGTGLFFATLLTSVATLVGFAINAEFVNTYGNWFTLVAAGFPALATAVFGIRFQGDFGGDALRSLATAEKLRQIDDELRKDTRLMRAADLTEQAARFMLADLDEWRLVNQQRDLSVG
jgi:hypothetical protein